MSEASVVPHTAQLAPVRARRNRLSAMEALERGFALFRLTFGREAWRYYTGTVPLVLCLIPMWVVNGQIRISDGALLMEAVLLAGGYLLRAWMVGSYMQHVQGVAFGTPALKPAAIGAHVAGMARLLVWKTLLNAGALTTLLTVAGASWFYSACQFASLEAQKNGAERHSFTGCLALSSQWFGGGLVLFLICFPLWSAVWMNGLIMALLVPQLLHSLFGVDTLLSTQMGMYALFQSSAFWLSLSAGAWVALDPVIKCTFVVVYQNLRSSREGDDLRDRLAGLPRDRQTTAQMIAPYATRGGVVRGALVVLAAILVGVAATARAAQVAPARSATEATGETAREARVQKLRQALDHESARAIYRWHDSEHPSPPTWFEKLLTKIGHSIEQAWNSLWDFLGKLWPRGLGMSLGNDKRGGWQLKHFRLWLILVALLTVAVAGVLFWLRRRGEFAAISLPLAVAPMPDVNDAAAASERSEDEWFVLASQLEGKGELRLALRAAYFGLLAGLAERQWLAIRRDRTNREYLNEFTRRWRRRPQAAIEAQMEIPDKLRGSLRQFDRVWYGSHAVTPEAVTLYCQDQREFLKHV